ncbi:hypothetical protein BDZ94DRAFT_360082 [Collybia nuda]|uniref:L-ornithine N(5)-monooxygenase [NAD(P)H] n=1 Tax=Collybia nuda TaxID=64659 RepID=A0A9P5YFT8_9AGAR|nr:hypothetical protein BDZ94DRAFT_360082 [Collybia nuda]
MAQITEDKRTPHVIIVGAGLAGISTAIRLKKHLRFENFTIYEKANAIGGTWRDNTYPGCGSDVPGHWYSLSSELNPQWSSYFVEQPEIRAYWEGLYQKYGLPLHTKLGHAVVSAEWEPSLQRYNVTVQDLATGVTKHEVAECIFYAIGGFMAPLYPKDIPGVEDFRGELWHSARWRHDVELKGKRVGVIGNGCSAAQFIPQISKDPSVEVINFCRTPQWYVPRGNYRYSQFIKWVFAHVPLVMRFYRNYIMARSDLSFLIFRRTNARLIALTKRLLSMYIKQVAPKEYAGDLTPEYPPGCKRIIVDPGYLESLNQPNVSLRWEAIDSIVEGGIKLKTGEIIPLDIIIFGTGYSVEPVDLRVHGSKGTTVHEYFATQGGATAYLGTCMPGFPNIFTLLGPNVATGHASVIFSQESQINFAIQLIKPILDGQAKSFEVADNATEEYNTWLQGRLSTSVWTQCNSYYQVGGQKHTKIVATFPGPVSLFWWLTLTPEWGVFRSVGAERWMKQHRITKAQEWGIWSVVLGLGLGWGLWFNGQLAESIKRSLSFNVAV